MIAGGSDSTSNAEIKLPQKVVHAVDDVTFEFDLRTDVKFHNGDTFTSEDVKYTYEWIMDEANASTRIANFGLVESVEAPDETTVVVTLTEPDVTFMVNVAQTYIYPSAYHAEVGEEEYGANPVGTGPFKLVEWNAQQRTLLERFDDHFRGPANFDEFQLDVVPEAGGRLAALESGQADNSIWALNAEDNQLLIDSGNFASAAIKEAKKFGQVSVVASSREQNYVRVPEWDASKFDPSADYFHITTNNTIFGTRFTRLPDTGSVVIIEGEAHGVGRARTEEMAEYFYNKYEWDFRYDESMDWKLVEVTPHRILAWGDGYDEEGLRVL